MPALDACQKVLRQQHADLSTAGTSGWQADRKKRLEVRGTVLELQIQLRSAHATLSAAHRMSLPSSNAVLDINSPPDTLLQHNLAAADVEKLSCNCNYETHPHYVNHADAGLNPVILITMLGLATSKLKQAYKVRNVLDKKVEALDSNVPSAQLNKSARGGAINRAVFSVAENSVLAEGVSTVHAAFTKTMEALGDKLVATHSTSSFDELHLFRDFLLAKEGLYGGEPAPPPRCSCPGCHLCHSSRA